MCTSLNSFAGDNICASYFHKRSWLQRHYKSLQIQQIDEQLFRQLNLKAQINEADKILVMNRLNEILNRKSNLKTQRVFDVLISVLTLPVTGPIMIVTGLGVYLESPGSIFFIQSRVGKNSMPFKIWKFRTMKTDLIVEGDPLLTLENDVRVSGKFSRLIRKYKLDELPQIINIIKGEMSIVGARPIVYESYLNILQKLPAYSWVFLEKPGLTNMGQLTVGREIPDHSVVEKKLKMELAALRKNELADYFKTIYFTLIAIISGNSTH
ncbi:MAG: sugar transferase [Bdellovibrionaceae bacterium]|jgi:lipopolysaccharide/colanic/teichoic acid biosynthesis glycosyltransferase|nr:sugar transferase [Pseudobdellovibrionaceae bacterium]